jgi:heptosyltransferase-1
LAGFWTAARVHPGAHPAWLLSNPYATFFHGTAGAAKRWSERNWISSVNLVVAIGLQVALPWGDLREFEAAKRIESDIPGAVVLPRLPLMDAVVLAQHAALVVGVDSGLARVAAAFERPGGNLLRFTALDEGRQLVAAYYY